MELSHKEFRAMNSPLRRFIQRTIEFPVFQWLGLKEHGKQILEIGCGTGYGAVLLQKLEPATYTGIDLMPEQIELAKKRGLANCIFMQMDAARLDHFSSAGQDIVVIFGILHHIPAWQEVIRECHRVLRPGGKLYLEEPDSATISKWDKHFHWGHPTAGSFSLKTLENFMHAAGFVIKKKKALFGFASYFAVKA